MFDNVVSMLQFLFEDRSRIQQSIDEGARHLAEGMARILDVSADEVPTTRAAAGNRDFAFYDATARWLVAEGFSTPAAYRSTASLARAPERLVISEQALGDRGTIAASWFQLLGAEGTLRPGVLALASYTTDGRGIATLQNSIETGLRLPVPPFEQTELVDPGMSHAAMLAHHRVRVAEAGDVVVRLSTIADFHRVRAAMHEATVRFRRAQGLALVERYIEVSYTGDMEKVGHEYLRRIRAHPEWYKYSRAEGATR